MTTNGDALGSLRDDLPVLVRAAGSLLIMSRQTLAAQLWAYGEEAASERVAMLSADEYQRVCQIGFQYALTGMDLGKAGCLAAIEVMEGRPRELRRSRRIWTEAPATLLARDPSMAERRQRWASYAEGEPVKASAIFAMLSEHVGTHLPDYRYFKTTRQFRAPFSDGISYIGFDRGNGSIGLRFGVRHDRVEAFRDLLFATAPRKRTHHTRTIAAYTANMGTRSPHCSHPINSSWPIAGSVGLTRAAEEITAFIKVVAEPYVLEYRDPAAIRNTLLYNPGRADSSRSVDEVIFAVDRLLERRDWLNEDYRLLQERYRTFISRYRERLGTVYQLTIERWDAATS